MRRLALSGNCALRAFWKCVVFASLDTLSGILTTTFGPNMWYVLAGFFVKFLCSTRPPSGMWFIQVAPRIHDLLRLPATMDPRKGVQAVCTRVLPTHTLVPLRNGEASMAQWLMGESMVSIVHSISFRRCCRGHTKSGDVVTMRCWFVQVFGKDNTLQLLRQWHQREVTDIAPDCMLASTQMCSTISLQVSARIRHWFRQRVIGERIARFRSALLVRCLACPCLGDFLALATSTDMRCRNRRCKRTGNASCWT